MQLIQTKITEAIVRPKEIHIRIADNIPVIEFIQAMIAAGFTFGSSEGKLVIKRIES